MYQKHKELPTK